MVVQLTDINGIASIGVYALATEKIGLIPKSVTANKAKKIERILKIKVIQTTIGGFVIMGVLACANSNGILLPHYVLEEEVKLIKSIFDGNIMIMKTKKTAYGNMVLANDMGGIVSPLLKRSDIRLISETLGVETVPGEIAGLPYVGSLAVATNKGVLAHPLLKETERNTLMEVLKTPVDVGTINCGIPYVGTGLISNSNAALAGYITTGPEIFIIGNALDVVKEVE